MIKRKTIIGFILILVVVFSGIVVVSSSEHFLYFEELNQTTILLENHPNASGYVGNFTDANNNTIARVQFFMENTNTALPSTEAWLIIHHAESIEIDSLDFKFKSPALTSIYLKSDPSNVQYSFDRELDGVNFKVEDFRWLGEGSGDAEFRFIIRSMQDRPNDLQVTIDLYGHQVAPIQVTGIHAHSIIDITLPNGKNV